MDFSYQSKYFLSSFENYLNNDDLLDSRLFEIIGSLDKYSLFK